MGSLRPNRLEYPLHELTLSISELVKSGLMHQAWLSWSLTHWLGQILGMDAPTSKAELEEALDELVQMAYRNGVEVGNGGYDLIHHEPTIPDWDLTITRME